MLLPVANVVPHVLPWPGDVVYATISSKLIA